MAHTDSRNMELLHQFKNQGKRRKPPRTKPKGLPAPPRSIGEEEFWLHLKSYKLDHAFVREYQFDSDRKWQFDFAMVELKIAVEVEGGTKHGRSRHSKGDGFVRDCEKYNAGTVAGWQVYRFTTEMVMDARAIDFIRNLPSIRSIASDQENPASQRPIE